MTVRALNDLSEVGPALAAKRMNLRQVLAVGISVILNALDGYDVLAITFAAPSLSKEWNIGPAQLGFVLSSGLVGMSLGSLVLAPLGDRYGRRPLLILSLVLMTVGTALTAFASGVGELALWRVLTGFGIGSMLAATNAVASEFSNERRRDLCVGVMTVGLPMGGVFGGFAAAHLLVTYDWRAIFIAGALLSALLIPVVWLLVPESLDFLVRRQGDRIRPKLRATLLAVGLGEPASYQPIAQTGRAGSVFELFKPNLRASTLTLVGAYFVFMVTFYFFSGWLPKVAVDLGYAAPDAVRASALMSFGGVLGGVALGLAAPRLGLLRLIILAMIGTTLSFGLFSLANKLSALQAASFLVGIFMFSGIVGLYSLFARTFPASLRVTGTGVAIGIGRGGAILGPIIGGFVIQAGASAQSTVLCVGLGGILAASILLFGKIRMTKGEVSADEILAGDID